MNEMMCIMLQSLLEEIESVWLGMFRGLLLGHLHVDEDQNKLKTATEELVQFCLDQGIPEANLDKPLVEVPVKILPKIIILATLFCCVRLKTPMKIF